MQGHKDSPLTEKGIRQAQLLADALVNVELEAIYSSSSGRTVQTARILSEARDIPVIPMDELREINLGEWEGHVFSEVEKSFPVEYKNFWEFPHLYTPVGGETFSQLRQRVGGALQAIVRRHEGKNVLVVTHAVALKMIMMLVENKELKELWSGAFIHPASLSLAEYGEGAWTAVQWGDTAHYAELE
jgi:probable phosphoglycerate mutase